MDAAHSDLEAIRRLLADLTARVANIERKLNIEGPAFSTPPLPRSIEQVTVASPPQPPLNAQATPPAPTAKLPVSPYPLIPPASPRFAQSENADADLESRIGSHWLNRIGIAAVLIGLAYFLKFAFDNNWIGPAGRITVGLLAGIAMVIWSERFRTRGYQTFSYSLKAVGIGALYLSLWAAFQVYALIPSSAAFLMMFAVTAATAAMAWAQDAQLLAAFALAGGFSTPLLLSTGENRELALFAYVLLLDLGTLALIVFKPWRRLVVMSFAGTLVLYAGWYSRFYERSELATTLAFATLFFAVFAIVPLVGKRAEDESSVMSSFPSILVFVNAAVYFFQAYAMINEVDRTYMAWFALALAAVYIFLSFQIRRRVSTGGSQTLEYLHLAVALGLITVAIPIRLNAHWITIGWFVEAGILLWIADRVKSELMNVFALSTVILGVVRLLILDNFQTDQLIFNMRMATYAVAIAVLAAIAFYGSKRQDSVGQQVAAVAIVALNALALTAFSHEVADYYDRQQALVRPPSVRWIVTYGNEWRRLQIERDFTYSALWMTYGAMLMIIGFVRRSAFVRWQALFLIAATILKVFIYDVSELDRGYRIVSFIVLGILLLAISFVYQRDWLKLSARAQARESVGS